MPDDKTEEQSIAGRVTAKVDGAGASAQGPGATAAGAGGVAAHDIYGDVQITNTLADTTVATEPALRAAYLNGIRERCGYLSLEGIDPAVANQRTVDTQLSLNAVYTALLTRSPKEREEGLKPGEPPRQAPEESLRSALEQLDRYPRLVLQGDPGSGKSTFVNFVALCLAGEALGDSQTHLQLLTAPLPDEDGTDGQESQPWHHGALLPIPVILRDLAATGLPAPGVAATAQHLWNFIVAELERANLSDYARWLRKELLERGGLLLLDGLDEVPEAEQRRQQVKQAVGGFAGIYKNCRILVTSRTYAYQKQDWRLKGFAETVLAPFSDGQIRRFITRWYAHMASLGRLDQQDAAGRAELLKQAIFNRPTLYELAQRPLLLALMVSLHAWRGGDLPEKREALYADTVDLLLNRWEQRLIKRDAQGQYQLLQPSLAEYLKVDKAKVRTVLEELAFTAHRSQPDLTGTADLSEKDLAYQLFQLSSNPGVDIKQLVAYLRDRAGLLHPRGVGVYTFPHRSFQEYLAACHLTDEDYPEQIAELVRSDPDRWREVALLAGAKAARGTAASLWLLVEALYLNEPDEAIEPADAWGAQIAAQALVETADLARVGKAHQAKLKRVINWLTRLMCAEQWPVTERVLAGDNLARLGDPRLGVRLQADDLPNLLWVTIPGTAAVRASGRFPQFTGLRLGNGAKPDPEARDDENWFQNAKPLEIDDFELAAYPVTVAQFRPFVDQGGYGEQRYWSKAGWRYRNEGDDWLRKGEVKAPYAWDDPTWTLANHPVIGVSWYEAEAYCNWLNERLQLKPGTIRLPMEVEWEWAARGPEGRRYPWGDEWEAWRCNSEQSGINRTSAVGCFPGGAEDYWWKEILPDSGAVYDLAGNVWEWTASAYTEDYSGANQSVLNANSGGPCVLRGGSWSSGPRWVRGAARDVLDPRDGGTRWGFRLART